MPEPIIIGYLDGYTIYAVADEGDLLMINSGDALAINSTDSLEIN